MLGGGTQTNLPGPNKSKSQVCGICGPKQHLTVGYKRALWIVIALNIGYGIIEIIGGFLAGSQALKADALDFLGDGLITLLGVFAIGWSLLWRARSALIQGVFLGLLGLGVMGSTLWRVFDQQPVEAELMGAFALIALFVNVAAASRGGCKCPGCLALLSQ